MKRGSREDFFEEHDLAPEKQHLTDASLSRTSSTSILFCGNSFTTRNSVPETIEDMCKQRGLPVSVSVMAKGGASLKQHWNAEPFNDGASYDMVVLQEQSTLPVKNKDRFFANVKLFAGSDKIKQLILFGTWARSDTREHGKLISDAYSHIAAECGCKCALVGDVFMAVGEKISLYDKDKVHANANGSYLAACVLFATMFDQNPIGLKSENKNARLLQEFAARNCNLK